MTDIMTTSGIIKSFILKEFLPDEDPSELTETTELVGGGILDSLATLKLIAFLEEEFQVTIEPHEASTEFDRIEDIASVVQSKS